MRIAVVGASGFIGLRFCETLLESDTDEVVPVVRSFSSLAVLARSVYPLGWRVTSFQDAKSLAIAMRDCDACVHVGIGDAAQIPAMARTVYKACVIARVKRLVWMSSSSVLGQNPIPGSNEDTPLNVNHPLTYNNAKVRAEWELEKLQRGGHVEVVRLRPSVVFGPRSRWLTDFATSLLSNRLGWIDRGRAICNTIYVDNLIIAARLACEHPHAAGHVFHIGDAESPTWRDFLMPIISCFEMNENALIDLPVPAFPAEKVSRLDAIKFTKPYATVSGLLPARAKRLAKSMASSWQAPVHRSVYSLPDPPLVTLTHEMALLQQCRWKLSNRKANQILGYHPAISFNEGMERSIKWLKFLELDAFTAKKAEEY